MGFKLVVYLSMQIGVNTRFLLSSKMEGFGWYTYEVVKRMVEAHPEHEFVFFFDRPFDRKFIFAKNVSLVVLFPPARHPILFKIWFNYSIKRALKKYKIDVFYSPDGYLSLNSNIPQVGVIHDINFEHYPEDIPARPLSYLRKYFPKFAEKATKLLTVSEYSKQDIVSTYKIDPAKITVAWNGASEKFIPQNKAKIEEVRKRYTNEKPYFIFVGAIHPRKNVNRLIAAFEEFAKKNASIDLLLVGESMWDNPAFSSNIQSDNLKSRIRFTGHVQLEELVLLMGAAHSLVFVSYFEGFGIPLVEAMRCGIPIISGNLTSLPEVVGEAALLVNPFKVDEITKAMHRLADDKILYEELAQKGLKRSALFSWDNTAQATWNVLEEVLTQVKSSNL